MTDALRRLYFFLVALFLAAPLIVVLGVSVNEKQDLAFPPVGFSLAWYAQIFRRSGLAQRADRLAAAGGHRRGARRRDRAAARLVPVAAASRPGRMSSSCSGWRPSSCRRSSRRSAS